MELNKCPTCGRIKYIATREAECFDCREKRYENELKQSIRDGKTTSTVFETQIYCPYCGEIYEADGDVAHEEGTHVVECMRCGKEFTVETSVRYFYDTTRKGEGDNG